MKILKVITALNGVSTEIQWQEPRGVLATVYDSPAPGVIRNVSLGAAGLLIKRGEIRVGIPLAELLKLAEAHAPELALASSPQPSQGKSGGGLQKVLALLLFLFCFNAAAAVTVTNLLDTANYTGTNNSASYNPAGRLSVNGQTLQISHSELDSTNALAVLLQVSFDNTNFITAAAYVPENTNAASTSFKPRLETNRIYLRAVVITTNAETVGIIAVSEQ